MTTTPEVPMPEPLFLALFDMYKCRYVVGAGRSNRTPPIGRFGVYSEQDLLDYAGARCAQESSALLGLIADIRVAAGDPAGNLDWSGLVAHVAKMRAERDALAERVKAMEANDWQTLDRPLLKVFFMAGDDPFVYAAYGRIAGVIEEVEKDLRENPPVWFEEHGDGDYTFRANYCQGEYGEYGRCVFPAGWELDLLAFEPLKDAAIDAAGVTNADNS